MTAAPHPPPQPKPVRAAALLLVVCGLCLTLIWIALASGARPLPPAVLVQALVAPEPGNFDHIALWQFRLPRVLAAALAGGALALSGMLLQSAIRNPLAEPQILGLNAGAVLMVTLATALGLAEGWGRPALASTGAFLAFALVMAIASAGRGGPTPIKVTLCGIVISAFAAAITSAVLILDPDTMARLRVWLAGDLGGTNWTMLRAVVPIWTMAVLMALWIGPGLSILALGEVVATGLGLRVRRLRVMAMICAACLCGAAVSLAGPVGFLGLLVPHILAPFTRARPLLAPLAALPLGAALLVGADTMARRLIAPAELSTGVMTGFFGAIVFIVIVSRTIR